MSEQLHTIGTSEESIPCFIRKTYKILEDDKYSDIISWNEDGTAVIIHSPSDFAQNILPTYFKHNNLNSFIRQLNMYDFHKKKTPDGEHVYYHELFQRDKKHLLKNIRRKNAESSNSSNEKSRLGLELVRTKQDIAAIVNENLLLKKMNREALSAVSNLENKVNELTLQNQALWSQVLKFNEKEEILKSLVPGLKRDSQSFPLSTLDFNVSNNLLGNKIPQTTTRIPHFSADIGTSKVWSLNQDSENNNPFGLYNSRGNGNKSQFSIDDRRSKSSKIIAQNQDEGQNQNLDPNLAADLSQQIVRNMDQELQYLKKLTSSNIRSANNHSLSSSPGDSSILGKRRIETDPGLQNNLNAFENISKLYKADPGFGFNLLASTIKSEGMEDNN